MLWYLRKTIKISGQQNLLIVIKKNVDIQL